MMRGFPEVQVVSQLHSIKSKKHAHSVNRSTDGIKTIPDKFEPINSHYWDATDTLLVQVQEQS